MNFWASTVLKTTIILACTAVLDAILHRISASQRHALWAVSLLAVLALPLIALMAPAVNFPLIEDATAPIHLSPSSAAEVVVLPLSDSMDLRGDRKSSPDAERTSQPAVRPGASWLFTFWAGGALAMLLRSIFGLRDVRRLRRHSRLVENGEWQAVLEQVRADLGVAAEVELRIGGDTIPPMTWGIRRHTILFPSAASIWTAERLRFVMAHELAHAKRLEGITQIMIQSALVLYWFNPLAWYAAYRMRIERERACDDHVLNMGVDSGDYAEHLLQIARGVVSGWTFATLTMAHPRQLESRLRSILDMRKSRHVTSRTTAAMLLGGFALVTLLLASAQVTAFPLGAPPLLEAFLAPPEPVHSEPPSVAVPAFEERAARMQTAYEKWINEDVVYSASDDERNAFLALTTDEERDRFIDQFWLRRDPTPGTPKNEFKEEHYERMAYANARFGYSQPGWQSDRGHMYIVYGKPDEIESHPAGGTYVRPPAEGGGTTRTYPFDMWTYRYIEGMGNDVRLEFLDKDMTGEYPLAIDPNLRNYLFRTRRLPGQAAAGSFPLQLRADFVRLTEDEVQVPITVQIRYADFSSRVVDGTHRIDVHITAQITQSDGRVAGAYEQAISKTLSENEFQIALGTSTLIQHAFRLRPGSYKLDVQVRDINSNTIGSAITAMAVPRFVDGQLAMSSLVLADRVTPATTAANSFVFGEDRVLPNVAGQFRGDQEMTVWSQIYGLKLSEGLHSSSASVRLSIVGSSHESTVVGVSGTTSTLTFKQPVPLKDFQPGQYSMRVDVTDNLSKETVSKTANFTVLR